MKQEEHTKIQNELLKKQTENANNKRTKLFLISDFLIMSHNCLAPFCIFIHCLILLLVRNFFVYTWHFYELFDCFVVRLIIFIMMLWEMTFYTYLKTFKTYLKFFFHKSQKSFFNPIELLHIWTFMYWHFARLIVIDILVSEKF